MIYNAKTVPVTSDRIALQVTVCFRAASLFQSKISLDKAKAKPPRVLPSRDKGHLIEAANGAFKVKQGHIFYNPTERQLDKIFEGELYGYR